MVFITTYYVYLITLFKSKTEFVTVFFKPNLNIHWLLLYYQIVNIYFHFDIIQYNHMFIITSWSTIHFIHLSSGNHFIMSCILDSVCWCVFISVWLYWIVCMHVCMYVHLCLASVVCCMYIWNVYCVPLEHS